MESNIVKTYDDAANEDKLKAVFDERKYCSYIV